VIYEFPTEDESGVWAGVRLGFGVRLLALATKPTSNIQFTATT
jgi:hypothetical protein